MDMIRPAANDRRDALYAEAAAALSPAIARLARALEADTDRARDLEQDVHVELWRSFAGFDGRCTLKTWTWRVAHNVAASHVARAKRGIRTVALDEAAEAIADADTERAFHDGQALARIHALIAVLKPADRSVILLYLEDLDAAAIGEITGLSPGNVAVKIHRIKALLTRRFAAGAPV
ncbi:MAG: sigma-70 family RNA polymerase sigma factor [Pseudomonadota bacterium]